MPIGPESPLGAMLMGIGQGAHQAQAILPNPYQPTGKAQAKNPFQGSIDLIINQILEINHQLSQQGDQFRGCTEKLFKVTFDLAKINNELTDIAEGDEDGAGY